MKRQDFDENILSYIDEELSSSEQAIFEAELQKDPMLQAELYSLQKIRQLYRSQLPETEAPPALVQKVLNQVRPKAKHRESIFHWGFLWRPALVGTCVLALTLGLAYQYKRHQSNQDALPLAELKLAPEAQESIEAAALDPLLKNSKGALSPQVWQPSFRYGRGLIAPAAYGSSHSFAAATEEDLYRLEQEAQFSVARFTHQEALRLYRSGDSQGAAELVAGLSKNYPNYPFLLEAMALRISCLFQSGQIQQAGRELTWLRQKSPELAQIVERRWR